MDNSRRSFKDRLYNLFTFYGNYSEFSTESYTFGTAFKNADSLESIHDVIHGATGSGGHMTYLDYSAYDPIFWLHHMMVDRAYALWQAVNPDSFVKPTSAFQDSYTIPQGKILDGDTRKCLACVASETVTDSLILQLLILSIATLGATNGPRILHARPGLSATHTQNWSTTQASHQ